MSQSGSLRDHFLISMPHLNDDAFARSLTYMCDHSEYGAMGFMINRAIGVSLTEILVHLDSMKEQDIRRDLTDNIPVYDGGPVHEERGYILHPYSDKDDWMASYCVSDTLALTSSLDILEAIARGQGPKEFLIALGHAGWGPGQLEKELSDNLWLSCQADLDIIFRMPAEERLQAAASTMGINLNLLSAHAGHA